MSLTFLFDMDGVLYDSMPHHAIAWQRSMEKFGIHMTEHDAYLTEGQRGIDTIQQMVRQQQGREITLDEAQMMYDEKARVFHELTRARIMPGVLDLMACLKCQGCTIGVVTGSGQRPLIQQLLQDFSGYVTADHLVTAYDVERGKPAPDPYLMGMQKCGSTPENTVVIENAPLGVRAGVASGAKVIAVNTGPLPDEVLVCEGAHVVLHTMPEVMEYVKF